MGTIETKDLQRIIFMDLEPFFKHIESYPEVFKCLRIPRANRFDQAHEVHFQRFEDL